MIDPRPAKAASSTDGSTERAMAAGLEEAAAARLRVLDAFTTEEIVEILAAAASAWCRPHYPRRSEVVELLATELPLAPAMLESGLDAIFGVVTVQSLRNWIQDEVENPGAMDTAELREGKGRRRRQPQRLLGPPVVFHALAGNVPGLGVPPVCAALLARSVCLLRDSRRQPLLSTAFRATLADFSTDLAGMVVPLGWNSADRVAEDFVFSRADHVEASGSDTTLRQLAERHPQQNLICHGTRTSIGWIPSPTDVDACRSGFAHDISLYDGRGCLTPHTILVEGPDSRAERFARLLAIALERIEYLWPRIPRDLEEESARRLFIGAGEISVACNPGRALLRGRNDGWLVHFNPDAPVDYGPGLRCVTVAAVADREEALRRIDACRTPLAAAGLALPDDHPARAGLAAALHDAGATLVCEPGQMQRPPLSWRQDGHRRLGDLLRWQDQDQL